MKTAIFSNIHSLEDIRKRKLRLQQKLDITEKSISDKTDITKLLFNSSERLSSLFGEKDKTSEIIGSLLPLGIKYLLRQIRNNPKKKPFKRVLIYSALGSLTAFLVYQYFKKRKEKSEE